MSQSTEQSTQTDRDLEEVNSRATSMTDSFTDLAEQAREMAMEDHAADACSTQNALVKNMQKIKWLFFDCDNTLVLSETLAFRASPRLVNEVLAYKGIDHAYDPDEILVHFMGLSFKGMCLKMAEEFKYDWTGDDKKHFAAREEEEVIKLFEQQLTAMSGAFDVLVKLVKLKRYNIAVVSSSSTKRIMSCLKKTNLDMFFLPQYIFSAVDSLPEPATKPDPAVYLQAMKSLGVKPEECVCVEDSRVGIKAAVDAGIPCIGLLQAYNGRSKQEQLVIDFQKDGVMEVMWSWADFLGILDKLEEQDK